MDMCHFGLVGSGNPNPSNFRATHMAAATLRPPLTPLVVELNEYCTGNALPWFTWCSIQVVLPQGTDTMGLHAHLRDALIVCVGSFTGVHFWVESGGLLNPSPRQKERHTRVCKCKAVEGWACKATPQAPALFNAGALHAALPWEGEHWSVIFYSAGGGGGCCTARPRGGGSLWPWVLGCPMRALTPPVSAH